MAGWLLGFLMVAVGCALLSVLDTKWAHRRWRRRVRRPGVIMGAVLTSAGMAVILVVFVNRP